MRSEVDVAVAAIAAKQCRLFSRSQAWSCGADDRLTARRARAGLWSVPLPGVYELPGEPPSFERTLWLCLLSAPTGAVVSHWSAGALHGLTGFPRTRFTLTVPHGGHVRHPIARVFQTTAPADPVFVRGLPVTPIARTLVDAGRLVGPNRLGAAIDDADLSGQCPLESVRKTFLGLSAPGRIGISTVAAALAKRSDDAFVPKRATLERLLDRVLAGVPARFEAEAPIPGREWSSERVDRVCRAPRPLVVEGDGRRWHTRVRDFPRDARRQRDALAAGYPTVHYTYDELRDDPDTIRAELRALLGLSRQQPPASGG